MSKKQMVAGLYHDGARFVLLIKKNKPGHWQHGRHNLLGGHVEPMERLDMAMVREFKEETGLQTKTSDWKHCIVLSGPDWVVHFFVMEGPTFTPIECDEGLVEWHADIPKTALNNLRWIIPLMLDNHLVFPIHIQDTK